MESKQFRCAGIGHPECDWYVEGNSEAEMLPQIELHAIQVHQLELKDEAIEKVRKAIRDVS